MAPCRWSCSVRRASLQSPISHTFCRWGRTAFTGSDSSHVPADHNAMASKTPPSQRLAEWLRHQRWFATKTRRIENITILDVLPLASAAIAIVGVGLAGGAVDRYVVALGRGARAATAEIADGFDDPVFSRALFDV